MGAGDPIPALDGFDLMVVMGGPMDVWQKDTLPWLTEEKRAIRTWVTELGKPYLGICLGHQLAAGCVCDITDVDPNPVITVLAR